MELFTEIEFSKGEFGSIYKVIGFLAGEGWEVVNTIENSITKSGQDKDIKAIKYKLRREI